MYLCPLRGVPADGAVQHITVLAINRRWLWTHVVGHNDCVGAAPCNLMNTVHLTGLEAHTARLGAWLEVWVVPSWRTWVVIACTDQSLRTRILGAQEWWHRLLVTIPHAQDKWLLDSCKVMDQMLGNVLLYCHRCRSRMLGWMTWQMCFP
jgi:hypothetical protein